MKEIKDSAGKLNENYLNYSQFYDIIQYYNDNKTINDKLQQIIDGAFNVNKPPEILIFEKFMNEFLPKIKELDNELGELKKDSDGLKSTYGDIESIINNLRYSLPKGAIPIITVKGLIKKINEKWSQPNKFILTVQKKMDAMKAILEKYNKDDSDRYNEYKNEFINNIVNNVTAFIDVQNNLITVIVAYINDIDILITKYNNIRGVNGKFDMAAFHPEYSKDMEDMAVMFDINLTIANYNLEYTKLQKIITDYSEDNIFISFFNDYSGGKYNEKEKVKKFYNIMDSILESNDISDVDSSGNNLKKIIAFKTKKFIEQNKISLPMIKIDVMMDFIDGKINNENYSKLQCSYMSNDLSHLILNKMYYNNEEQDYSFLKNNNYIYSIADNGIKQVNSRSKETPDIKKNEYKNNRYDNRHKYSLIGGNHNRKSRNIKLNKKRKTKINI